MSDSVYREFAAMQFYRIECSKRDCTPIRWGVLRDDLRKKYLDMADSKVMEWAKDEAEARVLREQPFEYRWGEPRNLQSSLDEKASQ